MKPVRVSGSAIAEIIALDQGLTHDRTTPRGALSVLETPSQTNRIVPHPAKTQGLSLRAPSLRSTSFRSTVFIWTTRLPLYRVLNSSAFSLEEKPTKS